MLSTAYKKRNAFKTDTHLAHQVAKKWANNRLNKDVRALSNNNHRMQKVFSTARASLRDAFSLVRAAFTKSTATTSTSKAEPTNHHVLCVLL
jgi:hypothetical protein